LVRASAITGRLTLGIGLPWKKLRSNKKGNRKNRSGMENNRGDDGRDEGKTTKQGKDHKQVMNRGEPGERLGAS